MRITGGRFRSRVLKSPKGDETRPTSDRVREALFSMIEARGGFDGTRVLDLYAGTGALGLEALSRGARRATFVERRREALAALKGNLEALGVAADAQVVARSVESVGAELAPPFDVVFVDPPYADVQSGAAPRALSRLLERGLLASEDALVVLEHSSKTPPPELAGVALVETRTYGDTQISFYRP